MSRAFDEIVAELERRGLLGREVGGQREAVCPAHDDRKPSLRIRDFGDSAGVYCHAGCEPEAVLASLDLPLAALFDSYWTRNGNTRDPLAVYRYDDEGGNPLYEIRRFDGKSFVAYLPGAGGAGIGETRRVLYRLPCVIEAVRDGRLVFIVEGEKDVHAIERAGGVATCNPFGAGQWKSEYAEYLRGAHVIVVADRDKAGRKHAREVAASLDGIASDVTIVEARAGKDASDHLAAGNGLSDLVAVKLDDRESRPELSSEPDRESRSKSSRRLVLTRAAAIRTARVRWLWRGRIPLRGLVVVAGEKGLGKSLLTNARLVAELTRGKLDGELQGTAVDVLVASAEDDWQTVVKPRLMAHGADLDRVHRVEIEDANGNPTLTLPDDVRSLDSAIEGLRSAGRIVGMLVIDPIGAFLSEATDSHREASVRRALAPLASLAMRRDLAIVVVAHLNKDESRRLIARVTGAGAFVNAPRSVLAFARNPDDPNGEQGTERVIVHVASNWGAYSPSLSVTVESREVDLDDGSRSAVGYLIVNGESSIGVEDLQRGGDDAGADCEEAIAVALEQGGKPSREVKATVAAELGCSRPTVERAARRMVERGELTIEASGFPRRTTWTLAAASAAVTSSPVPMRDATGRNDATEPNLDPPEPQSHHVPGSHAREGDATEPGLFPDDGRPSFAIPSDWEPYRVADDDEDDDDWRQR